MPPAGRDRAAAESHPNRFASAAAGAGAGCRYVAQTVVREQVLDVVMPCATYGGLYLQRTATGEEPIGCQDALRLGETTSASTRSSRSYATAALRVFRSLQQPGRFLVVPAAYRITRYEPGSPPIAPTGR